MFDWLRLAAAIQVMTFHYRLNSVPFMFIPAVPCFMGISGAVILQSRAKSNSLGRFWWKRFLRIQPFLVTSLVVSYLLISRPFTIDTLLTYVTFGHVISGNGVVWTLGCEEVAYLLLCVGFSLGWYKSFRILLVAFILVCPFSLIDMREASPSISIWRAYAELLAAFLLGNLLFMKVDEVVVFSRKWGAWLLIPAGLFPLAWIHYGILSSPCSICSLVATASIILWSIGAKAPRLRSDLSFGIYLLHIPVLGIYSMNSLGGDAKLAAVPLTIFMATLSWYLIEKPSLALKNLWLVKVDK